MHDSGQIKGKNAYLYLIFGGLKAEFDWVLNSVWIFTAVWIKLWRILLVEKIVSIALKFLLNPAEGN